ncbi:Hypothetical predicted protein [Prunus dulcis]|uniref:Uncharacterized protein n=1 Tax=Prunus dulcis TaxID=3755 RepID=A0A5E4ECY1_PRUDU|nr:hypothetical protein L3X38_005172 [Prunus dulcis]VVA13362.1 Hypothetical predicted protein [Prunus dulcis]
MMSLALGPLIRETDLGGHCVQALTAAPTSRPEPIDIVNDDPFNRSPIIRRITTQDRVDGGKRPSRPGPTPWATMNMLSKSALVRSNSGMVSALASEDITSCFIGLLFHGFNLAKQPFADRMA